MIERILILIILTALNFRCSYEVNGRSKNPNLIEKIPEPDEPIAQTQTIAADDPDNFFGYCTQQNPTSEIKHTVHALMQIAGYDEAMVGDDVEGNFELTASNCQDVHMKLKGITEISAGVKDLEPFSDLTMLEELTLYGVTSSNLKGIERLSKLRKLSIMHGQVRDIDGIKYLMRLTELSLQSNEIEKIDAVSNLRQLRALNLSENNINDVAAIANIYSLASLNISSNRISDVSSIEGHVDLRWLEISFNPIHDISGLSHLNRLAWFEAGIGGNSCLGTMGNCIEKTETICPAGIDVAKKIREFCAH